MADPSNAGNDAVGYKRPPKHSQFKPGQSGNPGGKPKGYESQGAIYRRLKAMPVEEFEAFEPRTVGERMAKRAIERSDDGGLKRVVDDVGDGEQAVEYVPDVAAAFRYEQEVHDRADGKPAQTVTNKLSTLERPTHRVVDAEREQAQVTAQLLRSKGLEVPPEIQALVEGSEPESDGE